MKFAIIAAGEGSRLQQEGVALPKPLVSVNGEALIDRLIRIFKQNGADEICIIVNDLYPEVAAHLKQRMSEPDNGLLRLVVQTTPSSMHSFYALRGYLAGGPFCLTTVDTIFDEAEFARFIEAFRCSDWDGMMAVTDYVDDEKPLYVATEGERIVGFHDRNESDSYVSGGIYCLRQNAIDTLERCMARGESRMRNFQRALIADGRRLKACVFSKILDVDHVTDIAKAESFLQAH